MKKFSLYMRLFSLIVLMIGISCTDIDQFIDRFEPNFITNDRHVLHPIWEEDFRTKDTVTFLAWSGIVHSFSDKSRIIFEPKSFLLDGQPLPNKLITLVIIRAYKKNQMARNLISTNAGTGILESAGMMHVEAFCEGKPLDLAPGKTYTIQIPVENHSSVHPDMEMFYGEETPFGINWIEADQNPSMAENVFLTEWQTRDSSGGGLVIGIECFPERLKWVNCDYFMRFEGVDRTEPCLEIKAEGVNDKITISSFCIFKNHNVIIAPCCQGAEGGVCFGPLPVGEPVQYIVVGKGETEYYLGHLEKQIIKDDKILIQINKIPLGDLKEFISKL
ncbi:MAG: hypothetical protein IPM48_00740 [Saprospiraceae bacterium]|nr:hypothetical protein [Saprospiraceae bacterium]